VVSSFGGSSQPAIVLVLTLVFGSPLALMLARRRFRGAVAGLALLLSFTQWVI
jgi:ABC-type sulfate transport system permease component